MSNNAEFDALARELRALREEGCGDAVARTREAMLVVRLVRGLSRQRWQEFCRAFPLSQWCALPVPGAAPEGRVADLRSDVQPPLPPDMPPDALIGALSAELFAAQLSRELLRLARNGGGLSLICTTLSERRRLCVALGDGTVKRLERLLAEILRDNLDACDSLGDMASFCRAWVSSRPGGWPNACNMPLRSRPGRSSPRAASRPEPGPVAPWASSASARARNAAPPTCSARPRRP